MRLARASVPLAVLAAILVAGCGSNNQRDQSQAATQAETATRQATVTAPAGASARSCASGAADREELRVVGVDCGTGQTVATGWSRDATCASPAGASRFACSVRGYRCLGTAAERGVAVSCARPGRSIAFVVKRG